MAIRHDVVITTLWHRLVGLFRDVEATPWGGLLLGNAWPAYLFALPLLVRAWNLLRTPRADTLHDQALLLQETVTVVFLGLVVLLFAIRRRAIPDVLDSSSPASSASRPSTSRRATSRPLTS